MPVSNPSLEYLPARLVKGHRWYIIFYQVNPATGERERFRETYELNRIRSITERKKKADLIVSQINSKLPLGYPFEEAYAAAPRQVLILDALEIARIIKNNTDRQRTIDMVESMCRIFATFITKKKWVDMPVSEFGHRHALAFLDYALFERKVGARTHNNYIERMRAMFTELVDREYISDNPFSGLKKKRESGKQRRAFDEYERDIVADYITRHDTWLMLGVLLQYHCFIRPIEQRRLRFYMISLKEGIIRMPADITKNKENAIVTIPDAIIPALAEYNFNQYDQRWLVFGANSQPHPDKCAGHNTYNLRHKKILDALKKKGLLTNIDGLSYYSWKDTGALELFKRKVDTLEIMQQLRHKDLTTTQLYCQSLYTVNKEIKALDNRLTK